MPQGLTLTQLLEEVQEDQEHRVGLVRLAESCLVLADPCPTPPLSHWAAARCGATVSLGGGGRGPRGGRIRVVGD